ncbi:MAG: DinB family protein [Chloroflexi bacterium]|nr:DinB family protein [Chloroflexota bacterium]
MQPFTLMFKHNGWANRTVLDAFRGEHESLLATVAYDGDPILTRAQHLASVERGFLDLVRGKPERPVAPQGLGALIDYVTQSARGWDAACATLDDGRLAQPVFVPWWEREFRVEEMLSQVLTHSAQHRAELAWELARAGVDTGELDYIVWAAGGQPEPGERVVLS